MLCWVCGKCENCAKDLESYCPGMITTYVATYHDGTPSYGGYSNEMIASEHLISHFPEKLPLAGGAPLLRAGITVYSPMRYYGLDKPGTHLGIVELGGLGHVAVKFAKAFGMKVTVISTFPSKKEEAINQLGAVAFLVSRDAEQMKSSNGTFDGIIDTVAAVHPILPLIHLLKNHGKLILVGTSDKPLELPVFPLLLAKQQVAESPNEFTKLLFVQFIIHDVPSKSCALQEGKQWLQVALEI